jgi:hypothetical protein
MQTLEQPKSQEPLTWSERVAVLGPPEWIRLPRFGEKCPYTGLSRTSLDHLIRPQPWNKRKPPVESRILQLEGERSGPRTGVVLINYRSLMDYIDALPAKRPLKKIAAQALAKKPRVPRRKDGDAGRGKKKETA